MTMITGLQITIRGEELGQKIAERIRAHEGTETCAGLEIHLVDTKKGAAIDGLKLTIPGDELRARLQRRIQDHQEHAQWWKREEARTPEDQTEEEPLLPSAMCANEAERHEWRAEVLDFIRDHIDAAETYRLGEADLVFGDLLPEKPGWLEQQEYEERTNLGFQLERLTKRIGERAFAFGGGGSSGE